MTHAGPVYRYASMRAMSAALAERISRLASAAAAEHGWFRLVLAGGATPVNLYGLLAESPWKDLIPWRQTRVFWGDERLVPHEHPASNYRMARRLLDGVTPGEVFPVDVSGNDREGTARQYETILLRHAVLPGVATLFDVVLLGMGTDGHTASLFPGSPQLAEEERLVCGVAAAGAPRLERITMTLPALARARDIFFMVSGDNKKKILGKILAGDRRYPAALVKGVRPAAWYVT